MAASEFLGDTRQPHFYGDKKGWFKMDRTAPKEPSRDAAITNQSLRLENATTDLNDAVKEAEKRFADCLSPVVKDAGEVKAPQDTIGVVHADFLCAQVVEVERATRAIREIIKRCEL